MYSNCASCCESFWTAVEKGNFARWVIRLRYIYIHTTPYALYVFLWMFMVYETAIMFKVHDDYYTSSYTIRCGTQYVLQYYMLYRTSTISRICKMKIYACIYVCVSWTYVMWCIMYSCTGARVCVCVCVCLRVCARVCGQGATFGHPERSVLALSLYRVDTLAYWTLSCSS